MDRVLSLLQKRRWVKSCLRTNIARPEDIRGTTFKTATLESNSLRDDEVELRDAIRDIAPEWGDFRVTLNRNVQCERHRDRNNTSKSWMLWLGDFEGGALVFDDGTRIETKGQWHQFDGRVPHWNEPHTGDKYSIILYRSNHVGLGERSKNGGLSRPVGSTKPPES